MWDALYSVLFMAWLVEHCSVDLKVGSSNPRMDHFFFFFFIESIKLQHLPAIEQWLQWTVLRKKSVADRIYEDQRGHVTKKKYTGLSRTHVHGRKSRGGGGEPPILKMGDTISNVPPPPTNLGIARTHVHNCTIITTIIMHYKVKFHTQKSQILLKLLPEFQTSLV